MATLKSLVDETSNIKNELVECHTNLKNTLIAKGVECSDTDKISSLIDKIGDITSIASAECGDDWKFFLIKDEYQCEKTSYTQFGSFSNFCANGSYRFFCKMRAYSGATSYVRVIHKRDGEELFTQDFSTNNTINHVAKTVDILNIKIGDVVEFYTRTNTKNFTSYVKDYGLSCNIILG